MKSVEVVEAFTFPSTDLPHRCAIVGDFLREGYRCSLAPSGMGFQVRMGEAIVPHTARILLKHPGLGYLRGVKDTYVSGSLHWFGQAEVTGELVRSELEGYLLMLQNLESCSIDLCLEEGRRLEVDLDTTGILLPEEVEDIKTDPYFQDWEKARLLEGMAADRQLW